METAKVFMNGGSQAVRLPKDCRFDQEEILANRIGRVVILMPKDDPWASMIQGLQMFSEDYLEGGIPDLPVQERRTL